MKTGAAEQIGTEENASAKWEAYRLMRMAEVADEHLKYDFEYQKRLARVWAEWRDAFLALDA